MNSAASPDIDALERALVAAEARARRAEAEASNAEAIIAALKLMVEKLRRELYGQRSERKARLLDQLRDKWVEEESKVMTDLVPLVRSAAARLSQGQPVPELDLPVGECHVLIEKRRMENVLVHLIETAQRL